MDGSYIATVKHAPGYRLPTQPPTSINFTLPVSLGTLKLVCKGFSDGAQGQIMGATDVLLVLLSITFLAKIPESTRTSHYIR